MHARRLACLSYMNHEGAMSNNGMRLIYHDM